MMALNRFAMSKPADLSLEQQLRLRSFETQVQKMSREQAQDFLVKLYGQMLARENVYREMIKVELGISPIQLPNAD